MFHFAYVCMFICILTELAFFLDQQIMTIEEQSSSLLTVNWTPRVPMWDPSNVVVATLKHHATAGDVQTCVSVLIALGEKRKALSTVIDEATQEQWLLAYIDLLARQKLWDIATQVCLSVCHVLCGTVVTLETYNSLLPIPKQYYLTCLC